MFGFSVEYVDNAPISHLLYWHRRAVMFAIDHRERLETNITSALKLLPGG